MTNDQEAKWLADFAEIIDEWKAHDDWQFADKEAAWKYFYLAAAQKYAPDAERYRWLRSRELDAIVEGGIFAGMTPDNVLLNGEDLDREIDAAIKKGNEE